jgi:UDP-glucuronate decarboxylase
MKILVTGGAGFIGNHLCRFLLKKGHKVICVDNLCSGYSENIDDLQMYENFKFLKLDITTPMFMLYNFKDIDQIYHLACMASPKYYQSFPLQTIKTCVNGTINILDYARRNYAKVLFTSTSEIYGEPLEHPQSESYKGNVNTLGIRSCYDEGKRIAETIMMEYLRLYNVDIKIVRLFNTYGPSMNKQDGRVVSNFIHQALLNSKITIYGDGNQTRSLCYIDDTVDGLVKMMNSKENGPINLGNPKEHNINYIADLIIKLSNSTSIKENLPIRNDDPTRRCPDITKAITLLEWEPKVMLEDGLKHTLQYCIKNK